MAERIVQMYVRRWAECEVSMFVRLQSFGRRFLTAKKMKNVREVYYSRKRLERMSCVLMQSSVRRYIASRTVMRLRHLCNKERELRYRAAVLLQNWYVRTARGRRQRRDGTDMFGRVRTMRRSILLLQRSVRGYQSREKTARVKIKNAVNWFAAAVIQRVFRGSRVPHWRDLRMNFICAFVLARHVEERDKTVGLARERYRGFLTDNRRDSASESDTDVEEEGQGQGEGQGQSKGGMWRRRKDRQSSEIVWVAVMDYKRGMPSWRNSSTGEVVYVEPVEARAHEKAMVGQIVRCVRACVRSIHSTLFLSLLTSHSTSSTPILLSSYSSLFSQVVSFIFVLTIHFDLSHPSDLFTLSEELENQEHSSNTTLLRTSAISLYRTVHRLLPPLSFISSVYLIIFLNVT